MHRSTVFTCFAAILLGLFSSALLAGDAIAETVKQPINFTAIGMFLVFVLFTLGITYWAASRTKTTADFYTAGGGITGAQNGMAIAGDYMSAATLLGLTAMMYSKGVDAYIYMIAFFVGWPIVARLPLGCGLCNHPCGGLRAGTGRGVGHVP